MSRARVSVGVRLPAARCLELLIIRPSMRSYRTTYLANENSKQGLSPRSRVFVSFPSRAHSVECVCVSSWRNARAALRCGMAANRTFTVRGERNERDETQDTKIDPKLLAPQQLAFHAALAFSPRHTRHARCLGNNASSYLSFQSFARSFHLRCQRS